MIYNEGIDFLRRLMDARNRLRTLSLLFLLVGMLALRAFGTAELCVGIAKGGIYWLCLSLVVVFGYLLVVQYKRERRSINAFLQLHAGGLIISFLLGLLWLVHEPWVDRILFDEYVAGGVGYMMHHAREAVNPGKAHVIDGVMHVMASLPDKRSTLFPFLVSVLHDVTGFRPQNIFILNTLVGIWVLPLTYITLSLLFRAKVAVVGVVLWFGFGLLPAHVNAAGYEILNLVFIQLWVILAVLSIRAASARWWDTFLAASVCLALLRNESVFFLIGSVLVGMIRFRARRVVRLSWLVVVAAVSLVVPVVANLAFAKFEGLRENSGGQLFFALSYLPEHALSALHFILNPSLKSPNHPLLGVAGLVAGVLFLVGYMGRRSRHEKVSWDEQVLFVFSGCIALCFILYMCTFWGDWNDPMVSRFSIPVFFWFLVMVCWFLDRMMSRPVGKHIRRWVLVAGAVAACAHLPANTQQSYTTRFNFAQEMEYLKKFMARRSERQTFLVTNGISGFIPRGVAGTAAAGFGMDPWRVQTLLDYRLYDDIIIADRFVRDKSTGEWRPDRMQAEPNELSWYYGNHYEVELLEEYLSSWSSCLRIYRLKFVLDVEGARKKREEHVVERGLADQDHVVRLMHLIP